MSVTNFEKETQPLTEKELLLVQSLVNVIRETGAKTLNHKELVNAVEQNYNKTTGEYAWIKSSSTLRKLVNYVVVNKIIPIASGSAGYWMCQDHEIEDQVRSLRERANSILARANALAEMKEGNYKANETFKEDYEF